MQEFTQPPAICKSDIAEQFNPDFKYEDVKHCGQHFERKNFDWQSHLSYENSSPSPMAQYFPSISNSYASINYIHRNCITSPDDIELQNSNPQLPFFVDRTAAMEQWNSAAYFGHTPDLFQSPERCNLVPLHKRFRQFDATRYFEEMPGSSLQYPFILPKYEFEHHNNCRLTPEWMQTSNEHSVLPKTSAPPSPPILNDLKAFAEYFKQRRMKLGITQADVGRALGALQIPGVECLSQSTICRFESLTLSHTNMQALQPLLQSWLDRAEVSFGNACAIETVPNPHFSNRESMRDGKRKRTCITDAERYSLETYFLIQPQPSIERIGQIAEVLSLKKNVVRVWFCNQRQKQKRLKCIGLNAGK